MSKIKDVFYNLKLCWDVIELPFEFTLRILVVGLVVDLVVSKGLLNIWSIIFLGFAGWSFCVSAMVSRVIEVFEDVNCELLEIKERTDNKLEKAGLGG